MNVVDKCIISKKVKYPLSFAVVSGSVNLLVGIIVSLFLNWQSIGLKDIAIPAVVGVITGTQFFLYYMMLKKEDVSNVVGLIYLFPIVVAILSFIFLHEVLHLISYVGMLLILSGVLALSVKANKIRLKVGLWVVLCMVMTIAINEFLIKISTSTIPEINGVAINITFMGFTTLAGLFKKDIRKNFPGEIKNVKWAFLSEAITFISISTVYFAMSGLPATIVASVAATQPLAVLFLEKIANKIGIKISAGSSFKRKLAAVCLIGLGVVLIYAPKILELIKQS
jgi:drug/metabolite transporter (DMT)-like permease